MNQAPSPDQGAPDAQPQGPQGAQGGDQNPMKAIVGLGDAMDQLLPGLEKAGAPPEALKKLQEASNAYKDFISILGGNAPSNSEENGEGSVPPPAPGQPGMAKVPGRNIVPAKGGMGY